MYHTELLFKLLEVFQPQRKSKRFSKECYLKGKTFLQWREGNHFFNLKAQFVLSIFNADLRMIVVFIFLLQFKLCWVYTLVTSFNSKKMFDILSYNGFCKKRRHSMTFSVYFAPYLLETMNNLSLSLKQNSICP